MCFVFYAGPKSKSAPSDDDDDDMNSEDDDDEESGKKYKQNNSVIDAPGTFPNYHFIHLYRARNFPGSRNVVFLHK